jgi:peptidoglycan/LPS O-acetylase OafA/YrhL
MIKTKHKDVQALKRIAVLVVLFFRTNENYFSIGYLGVDLLFVIFGFVITSLIARQ